MVALPVLNKNSVFFQCKMPAGYIKLEKPLNEVQMSVNEKFETKQYNQIISDEYELPSRYKLKCVFLYATPGLKKSITINLQKALSNRDTRKLTTMIGLSY